MMIDFSTHFSAPACKAYIGILDKKNIFMDL